jgi:hypothetical protein
VWARSVDSYTLVMHLLYNRLSSLTAYGQISVVMPHNINITYCF